MMKAKQRKLMMGCRLSACGSTTQSGRNRTAFTLAELLTVLAVLAVMIIALAPALARTKPNAQAFLCVNNLRRVMNATTLYTYDYHDLLPPNPDDGNATPGYSWCSGQAGIGGPDEFDPDLLRDPRRTLIAPYLNYNASVFHCPADLREGKYDGLGLYPASPLAGKIVPAARSISMSQAVGTIDSGASGGGGHAGVPNVAVNGSWLTGSHGGNNAIRGPWRTYGKLLQMTAPVPSELWVLAEESPFSINDCGLAMSVGQTKWIDYPSTLHGFACALAFGDGHAEMHQWTDASTVLNGPATLGILSTETNDWSWLAVRTSAPVN